MDTGARRATASLSIATHGGGARSIRVIASARRVRAHTQKYHAKHMVLVRPRFYTPRVLLLYETQRHTAII